MKRIAFAILFLFAASVAVVLTFTLRASAPAKNTVAKTTISLPTNGNSGNANENSSTNSNANKNTNATNTQPTTQPQKSTATASTIFVPIAGFFDRITKKPFGIYITPKTSPVQPERFTGYHTGADAETTSTEQTVDVPIYSIANGTVTYTGYVNGYGGVVIIYYTINGESMTALYGHLRFASVTIKKNESVTAGERFAVLGTGYSTETNGERKHLHFGLLPRHVINYKGYVQTKAGLSAWLDPVMWLKSHNALEPK